MFEKQSILIFFSICSKILYAIFNCFINRRYRCNYLWKYEK